MSKAPESVSNVGNKNVAPTPPLTKDEQHKFKREIYTIGPSVFGIITGTGEKFKLDYDDAWIICRDGWWECADCPVGVHNIGEKICPVVYSKSAGKRDPVETRKGWWCCPKCEHRRPLDTKKDLHKFGGNSSHTNNPPLSDKAKGKRPAREDNYVGDDEERPKGSLFVGRFRCCDNTMDRDEAIEKYESKVGVETTMEKVASMVNYIKYRLDENKDNAVRMRLERPAVIYEQALEHEKSRQMEKDQQKLLEKVEVLEGGLDDGQEGKTEFRQQAQSGNPLLSLGSYLFLFAGKGSSSKQQ
ncbi:hypothetical protein NHQ30_011594 [Ciborinia camelliae]|nr:hypothetical protein NHQ30_011594 [Ciborinia camelliae]